MGKFRFMNFIEFVSEFESIKPELKKAIIAGMRWGMWLGGIIVFIIFGVLRLFKVI